MPNMFGGDQLDPEYTGRTPTYNRKMFGLVRKLCNKEGLSNKSIARLKRKGYSFEDENITRDVSRSYDWYRIDCVNLKKKTKLEEVNIAVISPIQGITLYYDLNDKQQLKFVVPVRDYLKRNKVSFSEEFEGDGNGLAKILGKYKSKGMEI